MIRDLLLPMANATTEGHGLDAAISLARAFDAHLAVVAPVNLPLPTPYPWGGVADATLAEAFDEMREETERFAAQWRTRLEHEQISADVRVVEAPMEPPDIVALHARHCDLAVMALPAGDGYVAALQRDVFNALLLESGRPVLLVPPRARLALPARHALVAWQPRREATRALHDALALMQPAATVQVVAVDPQSGLRGHGDIPGADIAAHLARHGLQVEVTALPSGGRSVASALLRHATESGADLLIAGGYGHTRMREWALGGVTRELSSSATLPVLFSH